MTAMTSAGTTLAISAGTPGTQDATGYNALTYTLVGEITDYGEVGKEFNLVTHTPVASRRVQKFKGSYNNGSMNLTMARDTTDAGQTLMQTALNSDNLYAVRITLQNGKKLYYQGMVMSYKTNVGSVDQITSATCTIEVSTDIVEV